VGVKPNLPKGSKFDFDVVVQTYTKDGKSYGKVEKDRTKTFNIGDVVEMPNYKHWQSAIVKAQTGKVRTKDELKSFDQTLEEEADSLNSVASNDADKIKDEITAIINSITKDKQKELVGKF